MENQIIVKAINKAISQFKKEIRPLRIGCSERSFAHRLAVHMESLFDEWDIDCEYNRYGTLTKELDGIKQCEEQKKTNIIFPDIIVHHRTNEEEHAKGENLLVIEIKNNDEKDICDNKKLELMTYPHGKYRYQLGLYINIGNEGQFNKTWYKDGKKISEEDLLRARDGS